MFLLYYNVNFLSFLILIEFLVIIVLFYIIECEINRWLFLIFLVFSVCELVLSLSLLVNYKLWTWSPEIKNHRFDLLIILLEIY